MTVRQTIELEMKYNLMQYCVIERAKPVKKDFFEMWFGSLFDNNRI